MNLKTTSGSYFHNNLVITKEGEGPVVEALDDEIVVRLNGYAIVPIEAYLDLKGKTVTLDQIKSIDEMNEILNN